jgi:hypothetical protein
VLGGTYDLPHAETHAVVLPYVLAFNAPSVPGIERRLAAAFGASSALEGLQRLRNQVDAPRRFWAITPTPYPIPDDGPVGALLAATGRSPMRASHLHFLVQAPGFRTLVTHIFLRGDELLDRDSEVISARD